jgi:hypothetical protein
MRWGFLSAQETSRAIFTVTLNDPTVGAKDTKDTKTTKIEQS